MKASVTGTFNIRREDLEQVIRDAGHEIVGLSGKTDLLVVGEKTASRDKIDKAKKLGVEILTEINSQEILAFLFNSTYRDHYKRGGEIMEVGSRMAVDVYEDWRKCACDAGEWNSDDIMFFLKEEKQTTYEHFMIELNITVRMSEQAFFWTAIRRLMAIDYINQEFCDDCGYSVSANLLISLNEKEFKEKALALSFMEMEAGEKAEYREMVDRKAAEELFELI